MKRSKCMPQGMYLKCILMWLLPFGAGAQTLTLNDAISHAVANYPLIQQRQAETMAGNAHVHTVNGNRLPSLILNDQLNMGTANAMQGSYFPQGIVPSGSGSSTVVQSSPNPGNIAISFLQWEFYNFGYYQAQQQEALAQLHVTEAALAGDTYQLTQNIISLYLDWLKKYELLTIQNSNVQRASVILNATRATVLSGLKPGVDTSTVYGLYSNARIAYLEALGQYNYDNIALAAYTGLDMNNMHPDTTFIKPALLQIPTALPLSDTVPSNHPLLQVYAQQYELQLAGNRTVEKKYMPKLGLDGAAWLRNSGISPSGAYPESLSAGMPYSRYNYLMGLTFTYNVVDLKHRHDQLVEGNYTAMARKDVLATQQLALSKMMQQANAAYATTLEKLKELPAQLDAASMAYSQQMALYRAGLNTLIDVTNAEYVLAQAETNYAITQNDLLQLLYIRAGLGGQLNNFIQKK